MKIKINVHVMINRPPAQVFAELTDLGKWPQWGGNLVSMKQISAGPLRVGSQFRQVTRVGRKLTESLVEITEYAPNQTFGIKHPYFDGSFPLEPAKPGTRINGRFEAEATGLMALMYRLLLRRFVMADLRKFKGLVEAMREAEHG